MTTAAAPVSNRTLRGVIAAIPTPFTAGGEPDHDRFLKLARHLLGNGCDGLNVCGTTGEATSLSVPQRLALMRTAAAGLPPERLMVGTGASALADAAALTRAAAELGFQGALLLPPFYYKGVSDAGVVAYVERVAEASGAVPLYLYNFPALSGVPFGPGLVRTLLDRLPDRLAGLKDSSGDLAYAREVAALSPTLDVFPSNEAALLQAREGLFAGCISATANVNSRSCARAWRDGDREALGRAVAVRSLLSSGPLIPNVKAAVAAMMDDEGYGAVLPPLVALDPGARDALLARMGAAEEARA